MKTILQTEDICRVFHSGSEKVHALKNVSVDVATGALTILKGRSGSGKTTLMNIMGALDSSTSGKVIFEGKNITKLSESKRDDFRRKNIGFIFQSVALITQMSAYENVEFSLRIAGYPAKQRKKRAEECLNFVGLAKRMHHRPHEMSGGEQQRVAIARAIAHKPKLIFADEPTAELDTAMGLQIIRLFQKLVYNEGITILMTTHDPNMMELADNVYTLDDGEVIEVINNQRITEEVAAL